MKGLLTIAPDGHGFEIRSFGVDEVRNNVPLFGIFRGTQPVRAVRYRRPASSVEADYVYVLDFAGDKIRHMTKIWNDGISMQQLGWA